MNPDLPRRQLPSGGGALAAGLALQFKQHLRLP